MQRFAFLAFGTISYLAFFATFLIAAGFLANVVVPKSIDSGSVSATGIAVVVNLALLTLFAVQHSGMARPGFKRWWTRVVPEPIERSTYVLLTCFAMWALFAFWQPMPTVIWETQRPFGQAVLQVMFVGGLALVFVSTVLIDHFDLFGLRQVVLYWQGKPYTHKPFGTPALYKHVRHPLYWGWFFTVWSTPSLTVGHALFAGVCTLYILAATIVEERDLVGFFGDDYRRYQETVPKFIPRLGRRGRGVPAAGSVAVRS